MGAVGAGAQRPQLPPPPQPATPGPGLHALSLSIDRETQFQRHLLSCDVFYIQKSHVAPSSCSENRRSLAVSPAGRTLQTARPNPSRQCSLGRATTARCVAGLVQCLYASLSRRIGLRDVSLAVPPHLPPPKPEVAYVANINLSYATALLTIASRPRNPFPRRILLLSKSITWLHTHRAKRGVWLPQLQRANIWYRRVLR